MSLAAHDDRSSSGPNATGRWGQLTYTAFDASQDGGGEASGGWQVKQVSADLTDAERGDLLGSISTEISLIRPLSRFPSRSEVDDLPRRLRFRLAASGGIWCHSVHAGPDATGRPNNVFNHAVLDRWAVASDAATRIRPIQAWRSPDWLSPFGAAEVQSARLPADPPAGGEKATRATVVAFLLDDTNYRFDVFGLLLDAVAQALAGGPPVLLLAPGSDEGAMWVAAVSFFAGPTACLRLSFSTYERLDSVLEELAAGQAPVITVVPEQDGAGLRADRPPAVVVVDPREQPRTRTVEGQKVRQTVLGQPVPVTDWSQLALNVCCEEAGEVERCLQRLDEVTGGGSGPGELPLSWPLAAAVVLSPGFPLARELAIRILLHDTPPDLVFGEPLREAIREHLTSAVHSTEEAWARTNLTSADAGQLGQIVSMVLETYVRLALADDEWLLRPEPPPLPVRRRTGWSDSWAGTARLLKGPVDQALARLSGPDPGIAGLPRGVLLLRTLDFVTRLESLVGPLKPAPYLVKSIQEDAADLLRGQFGEQIVRQTGPLAVATVAQLGPCLLPPGDRDWPDQPPGRRLGDTLIELLRPGYQIESLLQLRQEDLEQQPVAVEMLLAEVFWVGPAAGGPDTAGHEGAVPGHGSARSAGAAVLIRNAAIHRDVVEPREVAAVLGEMERDQPWRAGELIDLLDRCGSLAGGFLTPEIVQRVTGWSDDPQGADLAARLLKRLEVTNSGADGWRLTSGTDGVSRLDLDVLGIVDATGPGWYRGNSGLTWHAAQILVQAGRSWPQLQPHLRRMLAGRVVLSAFQTALALSLEGQERLGEELRYAARRAPLGTAWRGALDDLAGSDLLLFEQLLEILTAGGDRLGHRLIGVQTRTKLQARWGLLPPVEVEVPLSDLPVDRLLRQYLRAMSPERATQLVNDVLIREQRQFSYTQEQLEEVIAYWTGLLPDKDDDSPQGSGPPADAGGGRSLRGLLRRPKRDRQ